MSDELKVMISLSCKCKMENLHQSHTFKIPLLTY